MLQIRLNKDSSAEGGGGPRPLPVESVTVACPDHLVLADLPVAKSLGVVTAASIVKNVGRKSRRQLGERVHFCVRCDLPIAIYGRLSPCEHAFCLDCARSDSICYLCDERIQKIQTIKMMEGLFICAAPHCLKSFLKKADFESHIHEYHAKLIQPNVEKEEGNESEAVSAKQSTASESTLRAPSRPGFSPSSNSQLLDREDKSRRQQPREQPPSRPFLQPKPPFFGQVPNHPSEPQFDNSRPPGFESGFESSVPQNHFHQQGFNTQSGMQQETAHFSDKQQGNLSENSYPEYAMHPHQPPNFTPVNSNPVLPPPFSYPPFPSEGAQPFYNASYEVPRQDSAPEVGSEQGSLLGFPPGQAVGMNFQAAYPQPWSTGPTGVPFEPPPGSQGTAADAFMNMSDPNGRASFFHGDYGRNSGGLPLNAPPPHLANKTLEPMQGGNSMDPRDGKGILAPQPLPVLPPQASHMAQHNRGNFYAGDMAHDGQGFGWQQHEKRDNFGSGQDS